MRGQRDSRSTSAGETFGSARFATTLQYEGHPGFAARSRALTADLARPDQPYPVGRQLVGLVRVLRAAAIEKALLLDSSEGSLHPDLLACCLVGLWPRRRRPVIVMAGAMWQPDRGPRGWLQSGIVRLADRAIARYVVQSSGELEAFPRQWRVDRSKMRLCRYFFTMAGPAERGSPPTVPDDVFAGGNSHRDYEPLLTAAGRLPRLRFFLATRLLEGRALPANVTARQVPREEFMARLASARTLVVPLRDGLFRAAGQQTYLNGMMLEKPVIVRRAHGVDDHLTDGVTGLVVNGSPESYVRALEWVFDPANAAQVRRIGAAARDAVLCQFTFDNHASRLLEILDEAVAQNAETGRSSPLAGAAPRM